MSVHTNSEKSDDASGAAKIRVNFSLPLLLLIAASMAVRAEPQAIPVNAVSASATSESVQSPVQPHLIPATTEATQPASTTRPVVTAAAKPPMLTDFSPLALYHHADRIVKAVILILIFSSVLSWSIWSGKTLELLVRGRRLRKNLLLLTGKRSLHQCGELSAKSCEQMRQVALNELDRANDRLSTQAVQALRDRVVALIQRIEAAEARLATRGASILATTSAVAPFIGLFGTVWGIMHSFISIAQSQTTNLSVVAPGIAEALFTTALGLVVAIPAVILYNFIGRLITGYRLLLSESMTLTLCLLSHDLDALEQNSHPLLTRAS